MKDSEKFNIIVGILMASTVDNKTKKEIVEFVREVEFEREVKREEMKNER